MESKRLQSKVIASPSANNENNVNYPTLDQSPERSRRKSKWATERQAAGVGDEHLAETDNGRQRRRLQDPLPLEDASTDPTADRSATHLSKRSKSEIALNDLVLPEREINPEHVPRSGYYFEHDDRSSRRPRQNPKWRSNEWRRGSSSWRKDDHWQGGNSESFEKKHESRWTHDGFSELQAEKCTEGDKKEIERTSSDGNQKDVNRKACEIEGGDILRNNGRERDGRSSNPSSERTWERGNSRQYEQDAVSFRGGRSRRFGGRVNDRWGGRAGRDNEISFHDRWKHDLFDEANRSPSPKQEEDPIAKIEALLAA